MVDFCLSSSSSLCIWNEGSSLVTWYMSFPGSLVPNIEGTGRWGYISQRIHAWYIFIWIYHKNQPFLWANIPVQWKMRVFPLESHPHGIFSRSLGIPTAGIAPLVKASYLGGGFFCCAKNASDLPSKQPNLKKGWYLCKYRYTYFQLIYCTYLQTTNPQNGW